MFFLAMNLQSKVMRKDDLNHDASEYKPLCCECADDDDESTHTHTRSNREHRRYNIIQPFKYHV